MIFSRDDLVENVLLGWVFMLSRWLAGISVGQVGFRVGDAGAGPFKYTHPRHG
jgi:hypothetical protein